MASRERAVPESKILICLFCQRVDLYLFLCRIVFLAKCSEAITVYANTGMDINYNVVIAMTRVTGTTGYYLSYLLHIIKIRFARIKNMKSFNVFEKYCIRTSFLYMDNHFVYNFHVVEREKTSI